VNRTTRPTREERREHIIDAAIELFSTSGFAGTTTRRLAEAVGISEAALYLHFDTKEELYQAIIRRKARENSGFTERLRAMAAEPPYQVFRAVADFMLETHTRDKAFLRLLLFSGLEQHALFRMFFEAQIRECADVLRAYVERLQRESVFRPCEPGVAVRAFMGMLIHHLLVQEVFQLRELGVHEPGKVAPILVSIFLDGLLQREPADVAQPPAPGEREPLETSSISGERGA
jgi:AcrR family transcriptional regulator